MTSKAQEPPTTRPAAMVGYFDDLSAELATGVDDPDRVAAIADRYAMEVVGPVPEDYV